MEWLLLLLLGSLAAGTVYWTASSRPSEDGDDQEPDGEGPKSSPDLPERQERGPIVNVRPADLDRFKDFLSRVPEPVKPQVIDTKEKSAKDAAEELRKEMRRKKKPLRVSFTTDQIIPRSSPHAFHRRPLQSAEQFVEQQLADEALNLYERVDRRVENDEINRKIRANIADIRRWLEGLDGDDDEPITFPEIIIPLTTQALALEGLSEGLRKISETLSRDIASALREEGPLRAHLAPTAPTTPLRPAKPPTETAEAPDSLRDGETSGTAPTSRPAEQQVTAATAAPIASVPQAYAAPVTSSPRADAAPTTAPQADAAQVTSAPQAHAAPITNAPLTDAPSFAPNARRIYIAPAPVMLPGDPASGIPSVTLHPQVAPIGPSVTTGPTDYFKHAREDFKFDEKGRLLTDGRTDEDFEKEWEKFHSLPLTDRREDDDRRRPEDEDKDRIDRRSRDDRRKQDLFAERDQFLESWKRHEARKRLLDQRGITPIPDADIIVAPYAPYSPAAPFPGEGIFPYAEPIGLPEADEHPLDKALEEARSLVDQIHTEVHAGSATALPEDLPSLSLPEAEYHQEAERPYQPPMEGQRPTPDYSEKTSRVEIVDTPPDALGLPDPQSSEMSPYAEKDLQDDYRNDSRPRPSDNDFPSALPDARPDAAPEAAAPESTAEDESLGEGVEAADIPDMPEMPEERGPVQEIRGVLELKPPDEDDAPFLTLTYDFAKIPDSFKLSRDYHTMEFAYYKYKPMLIKAQEFARRKMLKSALNYYRVIKSQNIPPEFRRMVNRNIQDITDYLEKFMMSRSGD